MEDPVTNSAKKEVCLSIASTGMGGGAIRIVQIRKFSRLLTHKIIIIDVCASEFQATGIFDLLRLSAVVFYL